MSYFNRLKEHHGTPIAAALTCLGFAAGAQGDDWISRGLIGAAIMSVFWLPVLWTARRSE